MTTLAASPAPARKHYPMRRRTGTARMHMRKEAVDLTYEHLEELTERSAVKMFAEARWGSAETMPCPHCGTVDKHYWSAKEQRWKCKGCGKRFSVTSGTVFADHKLPLAKIIKMSFTWATEAGGKVSLQLRREWGVTYKTAYTLTQKLREGLLTSLNTGFMAGHIEMDGMDINGRRYKEKRNKPQGAGKPPKPTLDPSLVKPDAVAALADPETGEIPAPKPALPPKAEKKAKQPTDRRIALVARQRGLSKGLGGITTRVAWSKQENRFTVNQVASRFISTESTVFTDEDPAYFDFKTKFAGHRAIKHSEAFSDGNGTSNNLAESYNWRARRAAEGIYLNPSNKYGLLYIFESAWREDVRKLSTGKRLMHLLGNALSSGLSRMFRGYVHGRHLPYEILVEGPERTPGRGKPKGWREPKPV